MWLMNRHPNQSVTYYQIGDSVYYLNIYVDIDENTGGRIEKNNPNNIQ